MTLTTIFLTLVGIYTIYIFYKMKMKRYLFVLCVLGVVGFVFGINRLETRNQRLTNLKFESLYASGQFAWGKVMYFGNNTSTNNRTYRASIHYAFDSKSGTKYESNISTLLPDFFDKTEKKDWKLGFEKANENDSFLVLYNPENPDESILMLDRLINKSSDFDKYIQEFEKLRENK